MAARPSVIAASIVGALALGTAGYFANEWRVCRSLEDEYISSIESYTSDKKTRALMGAIGVRDDRDPKRKKELDDLTVDLQVRALNRIYDRCGMKAGQAASARSKEILQDGMQDILSIP